MKFIIRYVLCVGILFMLGGVIGLYDYFARDLDPQIGFTQIFRMITGSVFVVGSMGLLRLSDDDDNSGS